MDPNISGRQNQNIDIRHTMWGRAVRKEGTNHKKMHIHLKDNVFEMIEIYANQDKKSYISPFASVSTFLSMWFYFYKKQDKNPTNIKVFYSYKMNYLAIKS